MDWSDWADGVLAGIHAQPTATNIDTLWAWSNKESGADVMRWNNPLNTTERMPGSVSMNSVGVQRFLSVQDGITATVATLLNGYYPMILDHLRRSIPRSEWQDACDNLNTWGTGCGWLTESFGAPPGSIGGEPVTPSEKHAWVRLSYVAALQFEPQTQAVLDGWASQIADDGSNLENIVQQIIDGQEANQHRTALLTVERLLAANPTLAGPAGPAGAPGPAGPPGPAGTVPPHDHVIPTNTTEPNN